MKLRIALTLAFASACAHAATAFSGLGATGLKNSTGSAYVAAGSLALLIVDIDNDGFLGLGTNPGSLIFSDSVAVHYTRFLGAGQLFGNDRIVTVTTVTGLLGSVGDLLASQDISSYFGKNFAVIWFDGILTASAPAEAPINTRYGIVRGNDWTFPLADVNGAIAFDTTDSFGSSSFWRVTENSGTSPSGFKSISGSGNAPSATRLVFIPEPSALMLGFLGILGCLRRRRN